MHGTPSRAVVWRRVAPLLATRHRVYVFDLLGFGDSERHVEQDVGLAVHGRVLRELVGAWGLTVPPRWATTSAERPCCARISWRV